MKLVISGATGFVGSELVRQSLEHPKITSVIALVRSPVLAPENLRPGADISKLHNVILNDFGRYPEDVKKHFEGVDACVWPLAITPLKSRKLGLPFEDVRRICQEYTIAGLHNIFDARGSSTSPFRFMYVSGIATERDQTKTPKFMPEYLLMRGETENQILAFAAANEGKVEVTVVKPGLITAPGRERPDMQGRKIPEIDVGVMAAGMLAQIVDGFEKEPLEHSDLVRIGEAAVGGSSKI